jgi:hypothetical protein
MFFMNERQTGKTVRAIQILVPFLLCAVWAAMGAKLILLPFLALIAVPVIAGARRMVSRQRSNLWTAFANKNTIVYAGSRTLTLHDDYIACKAADCTSRCNYDSVACVVSGKRSIFIATNLRMVFVLPFSAFEDEARRRAFMDALRAKLPEDILKRRQPHEISFHADEPAAPSSFVADPGEVLIRYALTHDEFRQWYADKLRVKIRQNRRRITSLQLLFVGLLFVLLLFTGKYIALGRNVLWILFACLAAAAYMATPRLIEFVSARVCERHIKNKEQLFAPCAVATDKAGLSYFTPGHCCRYAYSVLRRLETGETFIYAPVVFNDADCLIIPRRAFQDDTQLRDFLTIVSSRADCMNGAFV